MAQLKAGTTIDSEVALHDGNHGAGGDPHPQYVSENAAITGSTHPKITYDSKGLVTSGEALIAGDIPDLDAAKVTSGTFHDDRISQASVTQHESALTITQSQISDFSGGSPTGAITMFGGTSAPADWLLCDGAAVSRDTYSDLFAVVGTTYGVGNGSTTFNLPDMRTQFPVGVGTGYALGDTGGEAENTLTTAQLPSHAHTSGTLSTGNQSASHSHTGSAGNQDTFHSHSGSTGAESANHSHGSGSLSTSSTGAHSHQVNARGATSTAAHNHDYTAFSRVSMGVNSGTGVTNHTYTDAATNNNANHAHTMSGSTATQSANHTHSFTTGTDSAWHSHTITIGNQSTSHSHTVSGSTGNTGSGDVVENRPPYLALNFIIKT